jgi:hypothetical protein
LPFLERYGEYWGLPPDGEVAVREIERLRGLGAQYIAFMQPSFWQLDFYPEVKEHVSRYRQVAKSANIQVFALTDDGAEGRPGTAKDVWTR